MSTALRIIGDKQPLIEGEQKRYSWDEWCHLPTNECVWLKRCIGKADRIPIVAECASPTPLETLVPNVLFVPNDIEVLDRLHVRLHLQET